MTDRRRRSETPSAAALPASEVRDAQRRLLDHLKHDIGKDAGDATPHDWYMVTARTVRDLLVETWIDSLRQADHSDAKRIYYLSLEFLIGRSLKANMLSTGVLDVTRAALAVLGQDLDAVCEQEPEAALGNGGLGRLAACFIDSMATVGIPGMGYGIHYHHGMFGQVIENGEQREVPENWLARGNPWEFARPEVAYPIRFGGHTVEYRDQEGHPRRHWEGGEEVIATAYDLPIPGFGAWTVNNIRLWDAKASHGFDLARFNRGDYIEAVREESASETISQVLYPDDSTSQGKELRFKQEYFFAAASLRDILRRFRKRHGDLARLPEKVAVQLNDTHPSIAVPELMRLLMDEHHLPWHEAWEICVGTFAYTNHTLLPEALETWPVALFERLLPRHLEIIYEINARFLDDVRHRFPGEHDLARRVSLIAEEPEKRVRMAHLAFVGSHKVNGVARLHTDLMRAGIFSDLHRLFPDRIVNRTNGITPRRWLNQANPGLSGLISARIGDAWKTDLERLRELMPLAEDEGFRAAVMAEKREAKERLSAWLSHRLAGPLDPASLFDVQVKRIHEYKRQLLNVLHVIHRYNRLRAGDDIAPRTVLIAGKAAPGYAMAKVIIRLINDVADVINRDPATRDALKLVFVPDYNVSVAERIMPAADLSQQISTAGTEASGTGNMKLALNGALTIGTRDGANIEIAEEVGEENLFFFGLSAGDVERMTREGYDPKVFIASNPALARVLDMISDGYFSPADPSRHRPIVESLTSGDRYMLCADFAAYLEAQEKAERLFVDDPDDWTRRSILTIARMGKFSADGVVMDYAREIWGVQPTHPAGALHVA
ncbi:glycogen/starch/alpha-glucan phosphorylase [Caenispirillum salinarum]|uniref:glycogen/starch/alpha-glucan phosphorylase n=1 Tax=Caenispirillum salinarum TaxID=859058 RepID=UPI00384A68A4